MKKLVVGLMAASLFTVSAAALAEDAKDKKADKDASAMNSAVVNADPELGIAETVANETGVTKDVTKAADKLGSAVDHSVAKDKKEEKDQAKKTAKALGEDKHHKKHDDKKKDDDKK